MTDAKRRPTWTPGSLALLIGGLAGLAVVATIGDPGLTTDEPLDIRPGRRYLAALGRDGLGFFSRSVVDAVFRDNAEHPPLGRWLLGVASVLGQPFETLALGADPLDLYARSARLAPAAAFTALVGLVVLSTARRYGTPAGAGAGVALALMPRAFAHAHLGALDTFITFFWTLALFAADCALGSRRPVAAMAGAGAVWALALLTKIHAWFLIPVVAVWTVVRLRRPTRAAAALAAWAASGLALFFAGWPWLWYDTAHRLRAYLGTGVVRVPIRVLYFGSVYPDREVPWHYPWFYFAVTVPVGLHVLGGVGVVRAWRGRRADPFPLLLLGVIGMFLGVFSTSVPVYDGERLFLPVFPLWAVFGGLGFASVWEGLPGRCWARAVLAAAVAGQGYGAIATHPFGLSYYNALVGGLPGAGRLGLELTYWGDAVDPILLDRLARDAPAGAPAALVPTLYPGQGIMTTTRALARKTVFLGDQEAAPAARWLVVSRRTAYWPPGLRERLARARVVLGRSRQGVWLARLYEVGPEPPAPPGRGPSIVPGAP